jgi:hypothetical protein
MANIEVTSGMWRVDPQNRCRVVNRFGQTVAIVESQADASLIASAPDMCEVLRSIENHDTVPEGLWEEIQMVLHRVRGDFGLIFSHCRIPKLRQMRNQEWLTFMQRLWKPTSGR